MTINEFGGNIAKIWDEIRPVTKKMVERARLADRNLSTNPSPRSHYDATADIELSRLLNAADETLLDADIRSDSEKSAEISDLKHTCIRLLETRSASAEVFIQLGERAIMANDYAWLDRLGDRLAERYSPAEIAEVIRQTELPQIRAIACETLAAMPLDPVIELLNDPLYASIGYMSIEAMAYDFGNEDARDFLESYDFEMVPLRTQ